MNRFGFRHLRLRGKAVFQRHLVVTRNTTVWGKDDLGPKVFPFGEAQFLIYLESILRLLPQKAGGMHTILQYFYLHKKLCFFCF